MSRLAAVLGVLGVLGAARAFAGSPDRVVLADPDPELRHAVESVLAPWRLEVVNEAAPASDASALPRAERADARFVVWREGDQLVVFDRDRSVSERRPARAGALDAVTAAGAALSVKTMMRLPPPPTPPVDSGTTGTTGVVSPPPSPASTGGLEIRIEAGIAARVAGGSDAGPGGRALFAVMLRPTTELGLRLGARADLGTETQIDRSGFKGGWSDWAVLAATSWTIVHGPWELEPWLGGGVTRGTLAGTEMSVARTETATSATFRVGAAGRRRFGVFSAGLGVELATTPGAPTYTRATMGMGAPTVFEASSFSLVIGVTLAADLGR